MNNWQTGAELQEGQAKILQGQEVIHSSLARIANIHDQSEITAEYV